MLSECLHSVLKQGVPAEQIVVIDNGSRDDSVDLAKREAPAIKLIRNGCNAGFARAVNQGLELANGDFVLLLNNDAQLQAGGLRAFAEVFDEIPRVLIAGGQLYYPDGHPQNSVAAIPSLTGELVPKFLLKWRKPWALHGKPHASRPVAHALHAQGQTAQRFRSATRIEFQGSKLIFFRKTQGRLAYLLISAILPTKAVMNALSNSIACMLTLCLQSRQRARALGYWRIVLWHALGRPAKLGAA